MGSTLVPNLVMRQNATGRADCGGAGSATSAGLCSLHRQAHGPWVRSARPLPLPPLLPALPFPRPLPLEPVWRRPALAPSFARLRSFMFKCIMSRAEPASTLVPGGCQLLLGMACASRSATTLNLCSRELVPSSMRTVNRQQDANPAPALWLAPSTGDDASGCEAAAPLAVLVGSSRSGMRRTAVIETRRPSRDGPAEWASISLGTHSQAPEQRTWVGNRPRERE